MINLKAYKKKAVLMTRRNVSDVFLMSNSGVLARRMSVTEVVCTSEGWLQTTAFEYSHLSLSSRTQMNRYEDSPPIKHGLVIALLG